MKKMLIVLSAALVLPLAAMASGHEAGKKHANGQAASPAAATATKKIGPKTRYVHVNHGDTVTFMVGEKSFTWHFDTQMSGANFPLAAIAPADVPTQGVRVYVAPNPLYQN